VIYLWITWDETVWFLAIYNKDELDDLSAKERIALREMVDVELAARRRGQQRRKP
jgi:hypothetical protein